MKPLLFVLLIIGCGTHPCEDEVDCVIRCQCPGMEGDITVGPYRCFAGLCGTAFDNDLDCERPCEAIWSYPPVDDDSAR